MTSIYDENGAAVPCTVIEAGPCFVTQIRTIAQDGYDAICLGYDELPEEKLQNQSKVICKIKYETNAISS